MADQRSVMKEYRLLEQKRQSGALSAQEEERFAQLRDLVGPEGGAAATKPGFDVNAAAARLRESLLPGGLRNRPASMPEPPPPASPEPEPAAPPMAEGGLEAVWNASPFAPLAAQPSDDALFDPGTLGIDAPGTEASWDPNAQPYDPNAPQQWDAAAQGWDPNAQPYDPSAQPYDPSAQPYDPSAQPYDPNAQPYDPNAPQQWDPNAAANWEAAVQPAWDPNLAAPWGETPAAEPLTEPPIEPAAPAPGVEDWGAELAAAPEPSLDFSAEAPLEPEPEQEPEPASEPAFSGEVEPPSDALLPFDAGAASAISGDAQPEGWGAEVPAVEFEVPSGSYEADAGGYGDLSGPEQPAQVDALASEDAQGLLAPLGAGQELTSDDDAFAQGFQLASNGSFGSEAAPVAPAWSEQPGSAETEAWESAPSLELGAMAAASGLPPLDLAPIPSEETTASLGLAPAPLDSFDEVEVEEIPVVEGSDLLEELPPLPAPPAPPPGAEVRVDGTHRVVVHTIEGLVKRGVIADAALDAATLPLSAQPDAAPEQLATSKVKAIFFMLAAGEKAPVAEGKKVRVTFSDGRQIAGFSPDYTDAGAGFFMIPADTRTNTGRIWVYRAAVKSVSVS